MYNTGIESNHEHPIPVIKFVAPGPLVETAQLIDNFVDLDKQKILLMLDKTQYCL